MRNQDILGLLPAIPAGIPNPPLFQDNMNALDMDSPIVADFAGPGGVGPPDGIPDIPVFFSLAPGSPSLAAGPPFLPSDILVTTPLGGPPALALAAVAMGLGPGETISMPWRNSMLGCLW